MIYLHGFIDKVKFEAKLRAFPVSVLIEQRTLAVGRYHDGRIGRHLLFLCHIHQEDRTNLSERDTS